MEFWGVEVKSGQPLSVSPGVGRVLHLSQACLGEVKKDKGESVCLFVNVDGKKLVLGTLSHEKLPQQLFDLVFDKDFELTHNWKNGSVYFYGYKADNPFDEDGDEFDSDEDEDEDIPLPAANNGNLRLQAKQEKPPAAEKTNAVKDSANGKQKVKTVEPSKDVKPDGEIDDSDDSDGSMSEDDSEPEEGDEDSSDDDDDDDIKEDEDSSDEEDEETPKKAESGKKRPVGSATKTPTPAKKAKLVTPKKTDGKKGGHVATPHPSKQVGNNMPANKKSNQQTPKSDGSHPCKPCNRNFKTDGALQSHNQAKHSAGK